MKMESETLNATEAYSAARATHPRVSLDDMKAKIACEHFVTVDKALGPDAPIPVHANLDKMTLCILVMQNGFSVIGKSAPASPENFDAEKGRLFAYRSGEHTSELQSLMRSSYAVFCLKKKYRT